MRLIDADELIKDRVENDPVRIAAMCAPTAYDVDKVVKQLEMGVNYALPATNAIYRTRCEEIRNCLKIVKSGICQKEGVTDDEQTQADLI